MIAVPRLASLLLASLLLAMPLAAHQQKEAVTRVLFNPRTGNIEVMHRFSLHDAEHASRKLFGTSANLLGSAADRKRFEAYVHQQFSLADQNGEPVALTPVGNEIENQYLWVYAETAVPSDLTALRITHQALREIWPEQVNLVNVEREESVQSALFDGTQREVTITL